MPISNPFVLFRDEISGHQLFLDLPASVIIANTPESFPHALESLEKARSAGKWLAGYFSYEAGYCLEPCLRSCLPEDRRVPLLCFGVFDGPSENDFFTPGAYSSASAIHDAKPVWTFETYERRFRKVRDHLRAGNCYQVNLTFPFEGRWSGDPIEIFHSLGERQPVKHAAIVALDNPVLVSRSPELFFKVDSGGFIETHPMKGTAPRGKNPDEDRKWRRFLETDPKNQAENRMIVDLLRNDISRISVPGTVDVPEIFTIETLATVHQMISKVRARLRPHLTIAEIFSALFPCGSITGAPKISAMEILRDLESVPRNAYCGAIGWMEPNGRMHFNVAIRTISLFRDGNAVFNVGGGIVFDSSAEAEYSECLLKARFAMPATQDFI